MSTISRSRSSWLPGLTCVALLLIPVSASADWKGKVVDADGVKRVQNPASSVAAAETVELKERWRVGGDDDEVLFGVITDIIAGRDGSFYMLDSQLTEIKVYDPKGGYLRTIGREGEGPGEFRLAFNLMLLPNGDIGVLQAFPSKFVGLTPAGEPAEAFSLPESEGAGFKVLFMAQNAGSDIGVVYGFNAPAEGGFTQTAVLSLFDGKGASERELFRQSSTMTAANPVIAETEWDTFRNRWSAGTDGRIFSAVDFGKYSVNVWNKDGSLAHVVERDYPDHGRTKAHMDRTLEIYKGFTRQIPVPNIKYEIEDNWNPIRTITARDDGTLWVQTSRGSVDLAAGVVGVFDVFDKDGRFTRQVTLKGQGDPNKDGYFFVGDHLFVVTDWLNAMMALQGGGGGQEDMDEDAEPMEIICYELR